MSHVKTANYVRIIIYSTKKRTLASNFEHNIFFNNKEKQQFQSQNTDLAEDLSCCLQIQ